jgi:hypothetical protein
MFLDSGEDLIESFAQVDDEEVDRVIRNVERKTKQTIPRNHAVMIWKALRYRWFRSPEISSGKQFIHSSQVPVILVPKRDHRVRDLHVDFSQLDSDRQKMVIRRLVEDEVEGTVLVQDEVYRRQSHLFYELNGLSSSVNFWLNQDPRKMSREDPREEAFLNLIKFIELECAELLEQEKIKQRIRSHIYWTFLIIRCLFLIGAILWFGLGIAHANTSTSPNPGFELFLDKSYIRTSMLYMATFFFISDMTRKRNRQVFFDRIKRMHSRCRLLYSDIISFRLKTHFVRMGKVPRYVDASSNAGKESVGARLLSDSRKRTSVLSGTLSEYLKSLAMDGVLQIDSVAAKVDDQHVSNVNVANRITLPGPSGFVEPYERQQVSNRNEDDPVPSPQRLPDIVIRDAHDPDTDDDVSPSDGK